MIITKWNTFISSINKKQLFNKNIQTNAHNLLYPILNLSVSDRIIL